MSQHVYRVKTIDDSCLDIAVDLHTDLLTHETDLALVVREDDRLCMCLDLDTARQLGELLVRLSQQCKRPAEARVSA